MYKKAIIYAGVEVRCILKSDTEVLGRMKKFVHVLVASAKGDLLLRKGSDGVIVPFGGPNAAGEAPVRAAVRRLGDETGLDVRSEDLEVLDSYYPEGEEVEAQVFVLAGVDEDRIHVYGEQESLYKIHRNDDFEAMNCLPMTRTYVIDYFKRYKKW